MDSEKKIKRTARLIAILTKYGFADIVSRIRTSWDSHIAPEEKESKADIASLTVYQRIRMALEELGPTYVKFGQMFSNRDDLFPPELVKELKTLQDNVAVEPLDLKALLQKELGIQPEKIFSGLSDMPMAAASMSQIYKATLKERKEKIILKIKRPGIDEIIDADLLIMKDLITLLEKYNETIRSYNLGQVLETFDESIHGELSLSQEMLNMQRFAKNFEGNDATHVPEAFPTYSNDNILCMEWIDGIKVTDLATLKKAHLDAGAIATAGLDLYIRQILDHGFFHGDPHPGNIFVLRDGRVVFIDFGNMGSLLPAEMSLLEDLIVYFSLKDIPKLIVVLKKMAVKCNIKDEAKLQRQMYDACTMMDNTSVDKMDMATIVNKLKAVFHENDIQLPNYFFMLMRGLVLIEGIGRTLVPDLNIVERLTPYGYKIIQKRLSPAYLLSKGAGKLKTIGETIGDLPENIQALLNKLANEDIKLIHEIPGLPETRDVIKKSADRLTLALIIMALSIGSAILVFSKMPPLIYNIPVLGFAGFVISAILGIGIVISMIKERQGK
ncbi:MAG: AarF/UbiB family protein [Arachidicoccus sp.]|nr:AarF/UbiB family protein [Arachidicoccus sp.]